MDSGTKLKRDLIMRNVLAVTVSDLTLGTPLVKRDDTQTHYYIQSLRGCPLNFFLSFDQVYVTKDEYSTDYPELSQAEPATLY